jgi:membrane fusion protein (multidrug efflux system)
MAKRMLLMLAVTLAIVAGLGFVKFRQIQAAIAQGASFQPPPAAVTTVVAREETWPATLSAIGTTAAVQGVIVSADLPGIVDRISFESGRTVKKGDILVTLDTRQEEAQLRAAEAERDLAQTNYARSENLMKEGIIARADFDRAAAERKQAEARVGEIRAAIERKTIRAPFDGILGIRQANLGQYLAGGDPVVPLQSLNPIHVNFGVPQQEAGPVHVGRNVRIIANDIGGQSFAGTVTAIDSVVNEETRNVQVQATIANPRRQLRPGMFVQAEVTVGATRSAITLPASAINYAPYGDSVFVLADLKDPDGRTYRGVRQQVVKLGGSRGDQVAIVSGVKAGDEVVSSGVFKLRNGAAVQVNNTVRPSNEARPTPEES